MSDIRTRPRTAMVPPLSLLLSLLVGLLAAPSPASATGQAEVPRLEDRVTDLAHVFTPERRAQLIAELAAHEQETSRQIAVLTIPSLSGESIESFSLRVANAWGLGQKGVDNGILVTLALADRQARIEVGKGLESTIPDARAKEILDTEMIPAFKRGDYAGGLERGVHRLVAEAPQPDSGVECTVEAKVVRVERRSAVTADIAKQLDLSPEAVGKLAVAMVEISVLKAKPRAGQDPGCAELVGKSGPVVIFSKQADPKAGLEAGRTVQLDYWALPGFAPYGVPGAEVWSIGLGPAWKP